MQPSAPTKNEPTQRPAEAAKNEAKPKRKRRSIEERIEAQKKKAEAEMQKLKDLEAAAEAGRKEALIRLLARNGITTETKLQEILKKAGCKAE